MGMDIKNVQALADILIKCSLTSLEVSEGDTKIKLEKNSPQAQIPVTYEKKSEINESVSVAENDTGALDFNNIIEVRSPVVGVFYSSPTPETEPFVKIGSKVKSGDVLCIIETMKIMNEITSEQDGEIVDICIKNEEIAEFGQVLFKIF